MKLDSLYATRFPEADRNAKDAIWQVLCRHFFQRYVNRRRTSSSIWARASESSSVTSTADANRGRHRASVGAGAACGHRRGLRGEPSSLDEGCGRFGRRRVLQQLHRTPSRQGDVPHDARRKSRTVLRPGGRLLVLQPNIRFVGGAYWDFVDHHLPLTDRTLVEACESLGFEIVGSHPALPALHDAQPAAPVAVARPPLPGISSGVAAPRASRRGSSRASPGQLRVVSAFTVRLKPDTTY